MKKTRLSIIGMASAATLVLLVGMVLGQFGIAAPDERCLPSQLSQIQPKGFAIREPNVAALPAGAKLQAIDEHLDLVKMYYADFSMCPFDETPDAMIMKGAVDITVFKPGIELKDSSEFQSQELAHYTSNPDIIADVQAIEVNGYKGVGWGPYESKSIVRLNGEVIESETIPAPGTVRFFNEQDGTVYLIVANKPLDEILRIAESLQ